MGGNALVGRDRELTRVTGLLDDALAGRGWLVLCTGEAGIGKTRLAEELAAAAAARGVRVAWARRMRGMRITIRVRPGSARPGVGGEQAGALVVRVSAPAVEGGATEAALAAVAAAFDVRRDAVTLVTGRKSRTKVIEVAGGDPRRLADLLG